MEVDIAAGVGVADLRVPVLDEEPVVPVARWFLGEGEGDEDSVVGQLRPVQLRLAPGPERESGVG